jgi:hypothetical protein
MPWGTLGVHNGHQTKPIGVKAMGLCRTPKHTTCPPQPFAVRVWLQIRENEAGRTSTHSAYRARVFGPVPQLHRWIRGRTDVSSTSANALQKPLAFRGRPQMSTRRRLSKPGAFASNNSPPCPRGLSSSYLMLTIEPLMIGRPRQLGNSRPCSRRLRSRNKKIKSENPTRAKIASRISYLWRPSSEIWMDQIKNASSALN